MKERSAKWAKFQLDMFNSDAFQDLGKPATTILLYTLFQLEWHSTSKKATKAKWVCSNANDIKLHYATFVDQYKMNNSSVTRGIDSLLANGFIKINEQGGSCKGHTSRYSISNKWRTWKKGDAPVSVRQPFRKRGWTDPKKNKHAKSVNTYMQDQ